MRLIFRIPIALTFAAIGFVLGLYLPLIVYTLIYGDPGMPGGAGLALLGFPLAITGAIVSGFLTFLKLGGSKQISK
jgi:hypothetical protein